MQQFKIYTDILFLYKLLLSGILMLGLPLLDDRLFSQNVLVMDIGTEQSQVRERVGAIPYLSLEKDTEFSIQASGENIEVIYNFREEDLEAVRMMRTFQDDRRAEIGIRSACYALKEKGAEVIPLTLPDTDAQSSFLAVSATSIYDLNLKKQADSSWILEIYCISRTPVAKPFESESNKHVSIE